ncbi:hypothetical protein AB3S75_044993 [Citrus x aurantiifolia]
MAGIPLITPR